MPEEDLLYHSREPLNAETRLGARSRPITPVAAHYVRSHFGSPAAHDELRVTGHVARELRLDNAQLRSHFGEIRSAVTLECAGNGRAFLDPLPPGEPWRRGAASTSEWTGVALTDVLEAAGIQPSGVEVLFTGADTGRPADLDQEIAYQRSLPVADALRVGAILAYAQNGEPLTREHGAPLRLVVPRWYGMASVKWLCEIRLLDEPFRGFYQTDRYVLDGRPLREMLPRAVFVAPQDGARLAPGPLTVRGFAWCGSSPVSRVDVSTDDGATWRAAMLREPMSRWAWREWELRVDLGPGPHTLVARASGEDGETQPLEPVWNPLGYANNAVERANVIVSGR